MRILMATSAALILVLVAVGAIYTTATFADESEEEEANLGPTNLRVSLSTDGTTVVSRWTPGTDPDYQSQQMKIRSEPASDPIKWRKILTQTSTTSMGFNIGQKSRTLPIERGKEYMFQVWGVIDASGRQGPVYGKSSNEVKFWVPLLRPTGLKVSTTLGSRDVSVDWNDVKGADRYKVQLRRAGPGNKLSDGVMVTSSEATVTTPDYGEWVVRVEACTSSGCSLGAARRFEVKPPPLTASFKNVPSAHNGKRLFTFELHFSENFPGRLDYRILRDKAFQVENGSVKKAARVVKSENRRWTISVRPASSDDVVITLPATVDCDATAAVCTDKGRPVSNKTTVTVSGP